MLRQIGPPTEGGIHHQNKIITEKPSDHAYLLYGSSHEVALALLPLHLPNYDGVRLPLHYPFERPLSG